MIEKRGSMLSAVRTVLTYALIDAISHISGQCPDLNSLLLKTPENELC